MTGKDDDAIRIRVNDDIYTVRPEEVSRNVALECLQECGLSHEQAIAAVFLQPGKTALSAFIWLARRQAGSPRVVRDGRTSKRLIDEIWETLNAYEDDIEHVTGDSAEVAPDPGT